MEGQAEDQPPPPESMGMPPIFTASGGAVFRHDWKCLEPDLSPVHAQLIPGAWSRVCLETFSENWFVIGARAGSKSQLEIQAYGSGGLGNALRYLRQDEVQYAGLRVTGLNTDAVPATTPYFVAIVWLGAEAGDELRTRVPFQQPAVMEYFQGAAAVAEVDGEGFEGQLGSGALEAALKDQLAASLGHDGALDFANLGQAEETTHYDALRQDDEAAAEEAGAEAGDADAVNSLAAAMSVLQEALDEVEGGEGEEGKEGAEPEQMSVDAAAEAQLKAQLAQTVAEHEELVRSHQAVEAANIGVALFDETGERQAAVAAAQHSSSEALRKKLERRKLECEG